jgi:serine/threonine protein kinase
MEPPVDDNPLHHFEERLGSIAIDLGLMTQDQVDETRMHMILANSGTGGVAAAFGLSAVELGHLTPETLTRVENEERRRRRLIGGYEIVERVGTGTIATVYRAVQLTMDRQVALKILHPRLAADPVFVRAYIAEAQAVSRFHHPNIVQGFDAGESNGFFYFAHEYLSGGSIADKLRRGGAEARFSETRLVAYLRQTTAALRHAWAVAVYHGDINPGNLLLDGGGNIKLANLGVPRVAGLRGVGTGGSAFIRCGPEYAAPEQLLKPDLVDARTDMYSLGATFYPLSFGSLPVVPPSGGNLLEVRKANPVPSFSRESQEDYSGQYLRLIHDMLEFDPGKRPANPEELADRLERFHLSSGGDDLTRLARSVRQVAGPAAAPASSQRILGAPSSRGHDRRFSLRRRPGVERAPPGVRWLRWTMAAGLAAIAAGYLLFG